MVPLIPSGPHVWLFLDSEKRPFSPRGHQTFRMSAKQRQWVLELEMVLTPKTQLLSNINTLIIATFYRSKLVADDTVVLAHFRLGPGMMGGSGSSRQDSIRSG